MMASSHDNSHWGKRDKLPAHNRKAGHARSLRAISKRRGRREMKRKIKVWVKEMNDE